ncbi:MAG TPA: hypothetical protein VNN22_09190 [Verrucomicrobiae bacterium]|nr:hypothetical protein [Verrucomicrobiae bacterium]
MKVRKSTKAPAFVLRAERALRRAAHNVKTRNRALKKGMEEKSREFVEKGAEVYTKE